MDINVPKVRGNLLFHMKQNLRTYYDEDTLQKIIDLTSPETKEILEGVILSTEWYPETVIAEFTDAALQILGKEKVTYYSRKIAKDQLNRILKLILHIFSSPMSLSKNNSSLWEKLHNTGTLHVIELKENSKKMAIKDFDFITKSYQDLFVDYHCGLLEAIGAKNARGSSKKIAKNRYLLEFSWE